MEPLYGKGGTAKYSICPTNQMPPKYFQNPIRSRQIHESSLSLRASHAAASNLDAQGWWGRISGERPLNRSPLVSQVSTQIGSRSSFLPRRWPPKKMQATFVCLAFMLNAVYLFGILSSPQIRNEPWIEPRNAEILIFTDCCVAKSGTNTSHLLPLRTCGDSDMRSKVH